MNPPSFALQKKRLAARFDRGFAAYETGAGVQMELVERTAVIMRSEIGANELWGDLGSGGGMLLERLRGLPNNTRFVGFDIAFAPLRFSLALRRVELAVNGDIDNLPIRDNVFHGAAATSVLQWSSSPEIALQSIAKMLKPLGRFYFSIFVDGSFSELVELRSRMGLPAAVWLPTVSELLLMLDTAGFDVSVDDIENYYRMLLFPDALSALGSLSSIGATATGGRLLNRTELDTLCNNYTLTFAKNGVVPLTYRAIIGKVRKRVN